MSFQTSSVDTIYVIRWASPEAADHPLLLRDIERVARGRGKLRAIISLVPSDTPLPDDSVRRASTCFSKMAVEYAEQLIAVIEGTGMKCTVMRAAASAMAAMSGTSDRSFSEISLEAALLRCAPLALSMETILNQLRREGMLDHGAPR